MPRRSLDKFEEQEGDHAAEDVDVKAPDQSSDTAAGSCTSRDFSSGDTCAGRATGRAPSEVRLRTMPCLHRTRHRRTS